MRKLLRALALTLLLVAVVHADTLLDSFSDGDGSLGGNWNGGYGTNRDCQVVSGVVSPSVAGSVCWQTWAVDSYSGDQQASVVIQALTSASDVATASILLKADGPSTRTAYRCMARSSGLPERTLILKVESGTTTATLNSENSTDWVATDELKCTYNASTHDITVYQNGTPVLTGNDSALTGNLIGLSCFGADDVANCQIDDFKTADAGAPPVTASNIMVITVQ